MGQAKILAVDDEPDFEALLKQQFRRQIRSGDYAFRFARHGEEALTADCITSNWRMSIEKGRIAGMWQRWRHELKRIKA